MLRVASVATWNTSTLFLQPLELAKISLLCWQRLHQTVSTDDFYDPFHVVCEHIQTHLRTCPDQLSRQEVRRPHPLFERPEEEGATVRTLLELNLRNAAFRLKKSSTG